jgi:hypothetical protein
MPEAKGSQAGLVAFQSNIFFDNLYLSFFFLLSLFMTANDRKRQ